MQEINGTNTVFNDLSISHKKETVKQKNELGQSAFLELMITQLKNQDPLSPQDNSAFVAQLAQFSSVEGIDKLNTNFNTFTNSFVANQALQASSLVGRSVSVPAQSTQLDAGGLVTASVNLPSSGNLSVNIYSENGVLVDKASFGVRPAGDFIMRWDGKNMEANGELIKRTDAPENGLPQGNYRFEFLGTVDGKETKLDTALSANVNSVTVSPNGSLVLNLAGIGPVSMNDVKQFNE